MSASIATTPADRAFIGDNLARASPQIALSIYGAAAGRVLPYGNDPFATGARRKLSEVFERDVEVFLVSTGSAANGLSLAALTPPWGSVLPHPDSYIDHDECGALLFHRLRRHPAQGHGAAARLRHGPGRPVAAGP
ncbi:hypothetical protein [Streptomyces fagopyri]|uniref:hypothetical protein n=1 Tax=Streptomyces fagopyri TaxID=2662397 RepID=UPI0033E7E9F5